MNVSLEMSKSLYDALNKEYKGRIPMSVFDKVEDLLRPYMRHIDHRATYRGPRKSNKLGRFSLKAGRTCRKDATHVVLWYLN